MKKLLATSVLAAALVSVAAIALEDGPFTAEQARSGAALYGANCAGCHGARLQGAGEAPPLAGISFMAAWGNRSVDELYNLVKASMPYGNGNSLDVDSYRKIVAYVLLANGAKPGNAALAGSEAVKIGSVADGKAEEMSVDVGRAFRFPKSLGFTVDNDIRARIGWQQTRSSTFINDLARGGSSRLSDIGRSSVSMNADTDLSETVIFTLQGSRVITYDNNFNRRATQYVLSTVFQVQFFGEPK